MSDYHLPRKINHYRRELVLMYEGQNKTLLASIARSAPIFIQEEYSYDNWDGGLCGHALTLYLSDELFTQIAGSEQRNSIAEQLRDDFNTASASVVGESIDAVFIELFSDNDPECKQAVQPNEIVISDSDADSVWSSGQLKLFIGHKASDKVVVSELAKMMEGYGVACFVAHEDITPTKKWQKEIETALRSMDALLVFLTDDFADSDWTDQEIGVAFARGIPIIPLKLESKDPYGFFGDIQAIRGDINNITQSASSVFEILVEHFDKDGKIKDVTISALVSSQSYLTTMEAFARLEQVSKLTEKEIDLLIEGFNRNDQLSGCIGINNRGQFLSFLNKRSARDFERVEHKIRPKNDIDDEIPF